MSAAATAMTQPGTSDGTILVDTQHDDMVHDAQLDYYGCKLATSSSDKTVKIYDVSNDSYAHTATLQGHEGPVWQVSWAHPKFGVILATCSFDGSVLLHREVRPQNWALFYAARNLHESSVNSLSFGPHEYGLVLAAASSDGRVSILTHNDDDTWQVEYIKDNALGVNSVSWAPFGCYKDDQFPRLVTGGCDNRIRFWVKNTTGAWVQDKAPLASTLSHTDWVRDVAWSPCIVPDKNRVASCSEDKNVLIWTQEGQDCEWTPTRLRVFDAPVWRLSWSTTGNILAVSSGDSSFTLWKAQLDGTWSEVSSTEEGKAS
mmetsp:Transcript_9162/g.14214  ORF Transcript_9162/g.14214 Transcript_9162/m.14214 type:complete len:316 (-) Transcript_9162:120-1067(-)